MSHIDRNLDNAIDRLGLLLDHAQGMCMALSCEDFDEINEADKKNFYDALLHAVMDARYAFTQSIDEMGNRRTRDEH